MDLIALLGETLAGQVQEKLGDKKLILNDGSFIPRERLNEQKERLESERDALKAQLEEIQGKFKSLEYSAGENADLKKQLEQIRADSEAAQTELQTKLERQNYDFRLEKAIMNAGARKAAPVKALLDTGKISLDGKNLIGFDDQIKALKDSDGYLFGEAKPSGEPPAGGRTPSITKNPWKKENFNLTEQGRIMRENPELAQRMQSQV